jgi:cytochrome P450
MRDKTMPAGASVLVAPWLIHRHRLLWAQPDAFVPERWASSAADESLGSVPPARGAMRNAYLPFGMGPRVCIGAAFALQEATLILATLAQHWRFEPVAGHVPQPVGRLTIRSENGIRLRLFKRNA